MIQLSHSAASEIVRLRTRRKNNRLVLRLQIQSSGCLGLLYSMEFDESLRADDRVFDSNGVQIAVDTKSLTYVDGLVLDYSEDLMGGSFRFHNPQAVQSCGCGNSFCVAS